MIFCFNTFFSCVGLRNLACSASVALERILATEIVYESLRHTATRLIAEIESPPRLRNEDEA